MSAEMRILLAMVVVLGLFRGIVTAEENASIEKPGIVILDLRGRSINVRDVNRVSAELVQEIEKSTLFMPLPPDTLDAALSRLAIRVDACTAPLCWQKICTETKSRYLLSGALAMSGSQYSLSVRCYDFESGKVILDRVVKTRSRVSAVVDEAVPEIVRHLGLTVTSVAGESGENAYRPHRVRTVMQLVGAGLLAVSAGVFIVSRFGGGRDDSGDEPEPPVGGIDVPMPRRPTP